MGECYCGIAPGYYVGVSRCVLGGKILGYYVGIIGWALGWQYTWVSGPYFAETWGIKIDIALIVHRFYSQFGVLYHDYTR